MEQIFNAIDVQVVGSTILGATLFLVSTGLIAMAFWGASRVLSGARIESSLMPSLDRFDHMLATASRYPTGLKLRTTWQRRAVFGAFYTTLILASLLTPPILGFFVCGIAIVMGVGLYRSFERERRAERDANDTGEPLVDVIKIKWESLIGFAMTAWFLATALYRLNEFAPVLNGSGTLAILTPVLFAWNEIAQTLIPGDAGHVLGFDRFVNERATDGAGAAGYMIAIRAVMELTALLVIMRSAFVIKDFATGRTNEDVDHLVKQDNPEEINSAFERLEDRALKNRRGAQLRVAHIATGLRKDRQVRNVAHRMRAADILLKVSQSYNDTGSGYTAAQTYRQALSQINQDDNPITWASTQLKLAEAIKATATQSGDHAALDEAVNALQEAGTILSEEDAPDEWAAIHDQLGEVYQLMAEYDPRRLREAIYAYRTGLQLRKRGGLASDRARTQVRLSECLIEAGRISRDQSPVREAIAICKDAQEVHARAGDMAAWSDVRIILGEARHLLARQSGDVSRLQDADGELVEAIKETPRHQHPDKWAALQHVRGCVLHSIAINTADLDKMAAAIHAFEQALEVRTRDAMALEWAESQSQLGDSLKALGEKKKDTEGLARAAEAYRHALSVMDASESSTRKAALMYNLGLALSAQGRLEEAPGHLDEAIEALENAVRMTSPDGHANAWSAACHALGIAQQAKGRITNSVEALQMAYKAYTQSLKARPIDKQPAKHATTQSKIAETYLHLYPLRKDTRILDKALEAFVIAKDGFEAAGDRSRTAAMIEQIRRIRAVHKGSSSEREAPQSFGESSGEEDYAQAG